MFFMEGGIWGVNEKVIHVNDGPSFGDHIAERVIHEPLEDSGGVGESEEHDGGFE